MIESDLGAKGFKKLFSTEVFCQILISTLSNSNLSELIPRKLGPYVSLDCDCSPDPCYRRWDYLVERGARRGSGDVVFIVRVSRLAEDIIICRFLEDTVFFRCV